AQIGDIDLPEANIAVLVGTALGPDRPREYPDAAQHTTLRVHTLWGEMAYQLGGAEAYALVAKADQAGVSPGSDALSELFFKFGPCLVIVDELVAYARNLYGVKERLPGGTFESIMTFMQALTEAIRRTAESMLLVSVPESDIEVGGEAGKAALNTLAHIVGRIESIWKPVTTLESFEIVRRRLFASSVDYAARDAVVNAFGDLYRNAAGEFPSGVAERDYLDRMRAAYPIHPELFDRLYQDWSTLERFQRTRGVLRLMAAVIHQLWTRGDQSLLIMPGTLPLDATPIRNELLRYLPDTWSAVYETDIDGPESRPFKIDGDVPVLGRYSATRRVARTIFIGSAPSVAGQHVRGLEEVRIRLGCAQPGESAATFGDALRRMGGALTYLYTDGSRYWYDTRPTVNKLARDRAQAFKPADVDLEIITRLRKVPKTRDFAAFHVAPSGTSDVIDEGCVRVVVLLPGDTHKRGAAESAAIVATKRFLASRGNAQRLYKNMLVFIAPDDNDAAALGSAVRDYLAWDSINEEREELNLDAQQRRQVASSLNKANETVEVRLRGTYSWLIVPEQPEPLGPITFQAGRISGDDNFYARAARKLRNDGLLIEEWSPDILCMELERYIWNDERGWEVGLKQLWEYLAQYVYLPRLADREVLLAAVKAGVGRLDAPIAYATGKHPEGHHTGVLFRQLGQVYFDEHSLLVHPDHIVRPPEVVKPPEPQPGGKKPVYVTGGTTPSDSGGTVEPEPEPQPALTRYYGRVDVDAQRVNKDMGLIVEEVIQRLTSQVGCEVEITVEIHARKPDGFDESTVRTISENSRTLKFEQYEFNDA
ncbi:MAG: ATP-binding protein, partial [Anaerolineae bacterium]|nr:ATP-binding protein [Anaerolineae bacterium]